MGYTNSVRLDKEITHAQLRDYVNSLPDDVRCPCYIEGGFPSAEQGTVVNVSGSYGASGDHMRQFTHGIGEYFMKRGISSEVEIESLGMYDDITDYDAETQTVKKREQHEEDPYGRFW